MNVRNDDRVIVIDDQPAVKDLLLELRDTNTKQREFRRVLGLLGTYMALSISRYFPTEERTVTTRMGEDTTLPVPKDIYVIGVARAGIPFMEGMLDVYRNPHGGIIGSSRSHGAVDTLVTTTSYAGIPEDLSGFPVVVADPMLATGGTMIDGMKLAIQRRASGVFCASIISAPEGIERILNAYPSTKIFTYAIDKGLNDIGYIIGPGLGDAGQWAYGTPK